MAGQIPRRGRGGKGVGFMKKKAYRTPHEVAVKGFEALVEKLGSASEDP